jgi:nucleoside-diphosphate-sugar epimerase
MKTVLISGCAGFIGQNLVKSLISSYKIIGIDNFYSSSIDSIKEFNNNKNFEFIEANIINMPTINSKIDIIFNLACPASPPIYQKDPLYTLETNYIGTKNLLELAKSKSSIFIQASTSEVYGDPEIHPQNEEYNGNVNTIGIRSCYDEGKRISETLCYEYRKLFKLQTRIVRIFNTYGPGMQINDGRIISNFMVNSINKIPFEIYGDGGQTRSFCFVSDMIDALKKCMTIDFNFPINLGNKNEITLNKLAQIFQDKFGDNKIKYSESHQDDPKIRKPDIERAKLILKWEPKINISEGLDITHQYFKKKIKCN